jgi:hypothetical protein
LDITLFAGIAGFDKSNYLRKFIRTCLKRQGYSEALDSSESQKFIRYIKFEDELLRVDGSTDMPTFLDKPSLKEKTEVIERTFTDIGRQIKNYDAKHVFLDIHLSYFRHSQFTPPLLLANLRELVPHDQIPVKVITLIDDIFAIWQNLRKREKEYPETSLRLREILSWRSIEMLQAEAVAMNYINENRDVKNYLVAIRHPTDTLYNLVFAQKPICLYLSFPITNTRNRPECVEEINDFRRRMQQICFKHKAVLFDPVTIDELTLEMALQSTGADVVSLQKKMRWQLEPNHLAEEPDWPIRIPRKEVSEVSGDVENNIKARDFKLMDNSRFIAAYRPHFMGTSIGVAAEIDYSVMQGRRVYAYDPPEDRKGSILHPFDPSLILCQDFADFTAKIDRYIVQLRKKY